MIIYQLIVTGGKVIGKMSLVVLFCQILECVFLNVIDTSKVSLNLLCDSSFVSFCIRSMYKKYVGSKFFTKYHVKIILFSAIKLKGTDSSRLSWFNSYL